MSMFTPYLLYFKLGAAALILAAAFGAGCHWQKGTDAKLIAEHVAARDAAAEALRAAAGAIRAINEQAARELAAEKQRATDAQGAEAVAKAAATTLQRDKAAFADTLARARKDASCAALLDTDVAKVCGL